MARARRTTHRSSTGKKLYAVRDAHGRFKDIQTYKRAHGADIARTSRAEAKAKKKGAKKRTARRSAAK
jgi:DNA-binding protein HU-beta